MSGDKTLYTLVGLPFALWALQKVFEGVVLFRRTMRARLLDTSQLLNDIRTNLRTTKKFVSALEIELEGSPSPFEMRLQQDEEYYIFSASAESTIEVFQSDAVQRYSHLDSKLFDKIKLFYDLQKVIAATFTAAMSDNFKLLNASRKIAAVRMLLVNLQESVEVGESCLVPLEEEIGEIYRSVLWKTLLLSHRKSKPTKERSGDVAT